MQRIQHAPSRSFPSSAEADKVASATSPGNPDSPRSLSRRNAGLPGNAQPRVSARATLLESARKGGPRFSVADTGAVRGRVARASGAPQPIDTMLRDWVRAEPICAEARQKAAALIQRCHAQRNDHLDLSGLHVGTLPACIDRLPLRELTLVNCQLQTLTALPPTLTALSLRQNQLTSLPPLPAGLTKLDVTANQLRRLLALPSCLQSLAAGGNRLTTLRDVPQGLTFLDLSSNRFNRLPDLPAALRYLNLSNNLPMDLHGLPPKLAELEICHMRLLSLPTLPAGLTKLWARGNDLTELRDLPRGLTHMNVSGNRLHALPALPETMSHLIARTNRISQLPPLPVSLIKLDVSHNMLTSLPASITTVPRLSHIDLFLNQIPGPQLAAFVDAMNALGKNMSYIQFDRFEPPAVQAAGVLPLMPLQGLAVIAQQGEATAKPLGDATGTKAGAPLAGQSPPLHRACAQRVTDSVATQTSARNLPAGGPGGASKVIASYAVPAPGSPRSHGVSVPTGDWHLVEGLHEWEDVHPDELQRPEAN